mgnify:CR=1 FL=1
MNPLLIIDFDSTFIRDETLDEIAKLVSDSSQKNKIYDLTNQAMEGKIDFRQALKKRVELLKIHKKDINTIITVLEKRVSSSFIKNKNRLRSISDRIYIVSGGFKEIIAPIVKEFGINNANIFANEFTYDNKGFITGVDDSSLLSYSDGKIRALKEIDITSGAYVVGDGSTDLEMRQVKDVSAFICFIENINRLSVSNQADYIASSLDEVFQIIESA